MADRILAVLAVLSVGAYFLPLVIKVPAPALAVILVLVVLMAAYDFFVEIRDKERGNRQKRIVLPDLSE